MVHCDALWWAAVSEWVDIVGKHLNTGLQIVIQCGFLQCAVMHCDVVSGLTLWANSRPPPGTNKATEKDE